jgi:sugar phosphate isomerase/epimerase
MMKHKIQCSTVQNNFACSQNTNMQLKILCPQWGHEHLPVEQFFEKVKAAGYDGVDTWLPENKEARKKFIGLLHSYDLLIVAHQHQAKGSSISTFCQSFEDYLHMAMECGPLLINSHSGRDYFTHDEQLAVIDTAENFSVKNNITIAHETHRGRIGFSPYNAKIIFDASPTAKITADFSHWVCVTESWLENCQPVLQKAIERTAHIHARVGFTEGPQIPDPASPHWQKEVGFFLALWNRIFEHQRAIGTEIFTTTPEFGPPPYMWTDENNQPVADQWKMNVLMKELLRDSF